ncbi:MAG: fatty acid desaturase [Gemmatimonadota bacterium]|nr:fatty acid desaturase [Gemmatimonadota bacterium]
MTHPKPDRTKVEQWNRILEPYRGPDTRRSVIQLAVTAAGFVLSWSAAYLALSVGYWLTLLLALPAAGFLMRLFMIQHDCGHGSFFRSRRARDWVGRVIGTVMLTPYDYWKRTHAYHHAHSGDLDFRGFGDVDTYTVAEYLSWTPGQRLRYRLYRHPLVLFVVGPVWQFLVKHRYPADIPRTWKAAWRSVWWTNAALVGVAALVWATIGFERFLLVHAPVFLIATGAGIWLFYVQHQFEHTYWDRHESWDYYDACLHGSSYLMLPRPLQWLTAHIGVHHVHHMSPRIPNYRLQRVHDENPAFHEVTKLRARETLSLLGRTLWDEDERRLVSFRELRGERKRSRVAVRRAADPPRERAA